MPRDCAGKAAVVTGAGSGLGRALAAELAGRGCNIALVDVNAESLEAAERELARFGSSLTRHCVDVASEPAVRHLASVVLEEHGGVDLLINNAGISISAPFEETEAEAFERVMRVNFPGVVHGCRVSPRAAYIQVCWTQISSSKDFRRRRSSALARRFCAGVRFPWKRPRGALSTSCREIPRESWSEWIAG